MNTADTVTVLRVASPAGVVLTKTLGFSARGKWRITSVYGMPSRVRAAENPVSDIGTLAELLTEVSRDPKCCVIRGGIRPGFEAAALAPAGVRRLAYDRPEEKDGQAAFEERARRWIALDLDSFPLRGSIDPINDIEHVIDDALDRLPPEFRDASCFWQITSGHGIKEGGCVRLWFWLSRPITGDEAKRWVPPHIADPAIHRTIQPIYTAAPIIPAGLQDFIANRCGMRFGGVDEVEVPDLATWQRDDTGYAGRDQDWTRKV